MRVFKPLIISCLILFLFGCAHKIPATTGMTKQEVIKKSGMPTAKWATANGIECWKYQIKTSTEGRGGTWFIILQNDQVVAVSEQGRDSFTNTNALSHVTKSSDFMLRPRIKSSLNRSPDCIEIIKPPIGG